MTADGLYELNQQKYCCRRTENLELVVGELLYVGGFQATVYSYTIHREYNCNSSSFVFTGKDQKTKLAVPVVTLKNMKPC